MKGEKITLGITVLLAFSVFMLLIAENIPATSETVPLIGINYVFLNGLIYLLFNILIMILGIYLVVSISLTSLSIILTVIVLQFHYTGSYTPDMPDRFYNFFTKYVAKMIGMSKTVQIYESQRNLITKRKSVFKSDSEKITQLESSFLDYQNNMNSLKNDLILFTADQVHQSVLNSTKNKFRKKFNMNCGSGKIFKEIFLPEN